MAIPASIKYSCKQISNEHELIRKLLKMNKRLQIKILNLFKYLIFTFIRCPNTLLINIIFVFIQYL